MQIIKISTTRIAVLLVSLLNLVGCTSLSTVPGSCGSAPVSGVCLGAMSIPTKQSDVFSRASTQAIDAVHSEEFVRDLAIFKREFSHQGCHAAAWSNVDVGIVVKSLQGHIGGLEIETYGGPYGFLVHLFKDNVAFDGTDGGPIQLNRWALPRSSESIANTIAHEVSHRVGLMHPHSKKDFSTARCEPPYVIGSLVEKYLTGSSWAPTKDDCLLLSQFPLSKAQQITPADRLSFTSPRQSGG